MGERKENRVKMILPVHLTGKGSEGEPYSLLVHTLDFSRLGARLGGIRQPMRVGETVTLEYKRRRAHFAVRWVGKPGTRSEQQVGVESLERVNFLWLDVPDQKYIDDVDPSSRRSNTKDPVPAAAAVGTLVQELVSTVDRISGQESEPQVLGGEQAGSDSSFDTCDQDSAIVALEERIAAETLPLGAALDLVAENARRLLNGSGAAIALPENDEMVCRASAGRAPGIGVQFRAETGLTGEAVRSGRVVTCHNTLCDPRVDSDVWRKVGIRSAVSAPIPLSKGGSGVLEVFAAQANAFTSAHGILLEALSGLVGRLVATSTSPAPSS
ncbi:MAG: GAF domain-containing protein [Terriglobales bacterium]